MKKKAQTKYTAEIENDAKRLVSGGNEFVFVDIEEEGGIVDRAIEIVNEMVSEAQDKGDFTELSACVAAVSSLQLYYNRELNGTSATKEEQQDPKNYEWGHNRIREFIETRHIEETSHKYSYVDAVTAMNHDDAFVTNVNGIFDKKQIVIDAILKSKDGALKTSAAFAKYVLSPDCRLSKESILALNSLLKEAVRLERKNRLVKHTQGELSLRKYTRYAQSADICEDMLDQVDEITQKPEKKKTQPKTKIKTK